VERAARKGTKAERLRAGFGKVAAHKNTLAAFQQRNVSTRGTLIRGASSNASYSGHWLAARVKVALDTAQKLLTRLTRHRARIHKSDRAMQINGTVSGAHRYDENSVARFCHIRSRFFLLRKHCEWLECMHSPPCSLERIPDTIWIRFACAGAKRCARRNRR
jgi:hypothetical protein